MSASNIVQLFLILALFFTSIGGIVVASVLKAMDNVVKVRKSNFKNVCNQGQVILMVTQQKIAKMCFD